MSSSDTSFLGHPRGLAVLFFAEMWERFSYYGMRGLLILYLTKHWLFSDAVASGIYASYAAMVYLTPVIGGLVADQYRHGFAFTGDGPVSDSLGIWRLQTLVFLGKKL